MFGLIFLSLLSSFVETKDCFRLNHTVFQLLQFDQKQFFFVRRAKSFPKTSATKGLAYPSLEFKEYFDDS